MGSVFGGPQTVPQTSQTSQAINQASTSQQASAQAAQQVSQIQPGPQAQQLGGNILNWSTVVGQPGAVPLQGVAELNQPQLTGITNLINQGTGMQPLIGQGQGYLGQGTGLMGQAGQGITAQDINNFYNPMAGNVTAQLQNIFGQQNLANRLGSAAEAGGIGGDRAAVAAGLLANQQTLGAGQIYSQLYQNALQAAQQQKAQQLGAGQALAGTAFPTMQAGFGGLGTALGAAAIPQQQQQQVLNAAYQQAMGQYQDPFLRMQALGAAVGPMNQAFGVTQAGQQAGMAGGQTGTQLTGTQLGTGVGTTTYPAPAILPQVAGLGSLALGLGGMFSDRRGKTDIQKVGHHSGTGLPLYAFRYKGDPKTYPKVVGPMAQDVAKRYPGAVQKLQSGGAVLPALPTSLLSGANLPAFSSTLSLPTTSQLSPMLTQAQSMIPQLTSMLGGFSAPAQTAAPAATTAAPTTGSPYSWAPGQPVSQSMQAQLAAQPASFWQGVNPQNMGLGRGFVTGGGGGYGLRHGGRVTYQDGGSVDNDNDSEPDDDTDDRSSTTFLGLDKGKIQKGMSALNQYAKSGQTKTPQVQALKMPSTPWSLGQMPQVTPLAAPTMQSGGSADSDNSGGGSGGKTVQSADSDLASLRFETMANLAQGREVPPFQKGFPIGGRVGYQDSGRVESTRLPVQADDLPDDDGEDDGGEDIPMPTPRPTEAPLEEFGPRLPPALPRGRILPGPTGGMGGLGGFAQSPYMALAQAGLGMLAASGQRDARGLPMSPLGAIGAGGMAGMNTLQQQQQFALKQQALQDMTAHRRMLEQAAMARVNRPIKMTDPETGEDYLADPNTGRRIGATETPAATVPQREAGNLVQGTPATATDAAALAEKEDDAAIPVNAKLVQHGNFDYSTGSPGEIEKGFDLPTPAPITGPSGTMSSRAIMQDAEKYLRTGQLPPGRMGMSAKNPIVRQQQKYIQAVRNYAGAKAASLGMSVEEVTSAQRRSSLMGRWILSPQGGIAAGATGTVMRHIETLDKLYAAMEEERTTGTRSQAANRLLSVIGKQFGAPAAQSLDSAAHIVGTELIRALGVSGGGALADRQEAASTWSSKLTPEQWRGPNGTKSTMLELLAGRLVTGENLAGEATVPKDEFKRIVGPENYSQLMKVRKELEQRQAAGKAGAPLTEGPTQARKVNRAKAKAAGWTDEEIDAYERGR